MYRRADRRITGKKIVGSKERKAARLTRRAADLLKGRKVIGSEEWGFEKMERLHRALEEYAKRLTDEYSGLYRLFLQSEHPENEPGLGGLVIKLSDDRYDFITPIEGRTEIGGIEVEIERMGEYESLENEGYFTNDVWVYLPYLNDKVHIGNLHEWFLISDYYDEDSEDVYYVTYDSFGWCIVKRGMELIEKGY